jgi:hypothetical protein
VILYKKNDILVHTSSVAPSYPLIVDTAFNEEGGTLTSPIIFGNWFLVRPSSRVIWRFANQQWDRLLYPYDILSLYTTPAGILLAGTADGKIVAINEGVQDDGADIPVFIMMPDSDGGVPLSRKDPVDFQIDVDTGGGIGIASFSKDGGVFGNDIPFVTSGDQVFRSELTSLGVYYRVQMSLSGNFSRFDLRGYNITGRPRPQQVMAFDLGYVVPENGDMAWLSEAEVDCISPVNLDLRVYRDDVLYTTQPVVVVPEKRSLYRVPLPRETKSRRIRLVLATTNPAGSSHPGFEPYDVRVRHQGSGNVTSLMPVRSDG